MTLHYAASYSLDQTQNTIYTMETSTTSIVDRSILLIGILPFNYATFR